MRKTYSILAAATLAAGSWAFLGRDTVAFGDDQGAGASASISTEHNNGVSLPQGVTRSDRADEAGVRRTLAGVVSAVLSEDQGGVANLSQYLASDDRGRFNDLGRNDTMLRDKIAQLRRDLNAKYGQQFRTDDAQAFNSSFKDFVIVQGEVSNPALLSDWPVEPTGRANTRENTGGQIDTKINTNTNTRTDTEAHDTSTSAQKRDDVGGPGRPAIGGQSTGSTSVTSSSSSSSTTGNAPAGEGNVSTHYDRGMNLAVATFPASHGAPEINVSLVRQSMANAHENGQAHTEVNTTTSEKGSTDQASADQRKRADVGGPGTPATGGINSTKGESASITNSTTTGNNGAENPGAAANLAAGNWKVDLPNTVTSDRLQRELAMHLDEVDRMKDQWPADSTEAYRMVAHHIFMALYDVNSNAAK